MQYFSVPRVFLQAGEASCIAAFASDLAGLFHTQKHFLLMTTCDKVTSTIELSISEWSPFTLIACLSGKTGLAKCTGIQMFNRILRDTSSFIRTWGFVSRNISNWEICLR